LQVEECRTILHRWQQVQQQKPECILNESSEQVIQQVLLVKQIVRGSRILLDYLLQWHILHYLFQDQVENRADQWLLLVLKGFNLDDAAIYYLHDLPKIVVGFLVGLFEEHWLALSRQGMVASVITLLEEQIPLLHNFVRPHCDGRWIQFPIQYLHYQKSTLDILASISRMSLGKYFPFVDSANFTTERGYLSSILADRYMAAAPTSCN
jgi:hypothetical protein